ncbi:glycosyltransferase family 2 protein [Parahalioglobus pacificus]|uniref:glycosyltransferase family 2 protein n=1 Tax=Parahalioglobus pacificus TaxID=930806 RepID=UPI0016785CE5|nr:glycosyltransferase family 2 protein [Halioglobus pacificus]
MDGEEALVETVRSKIETVDWPCRVEKRISEVNLGCKAGVASAIDWFFDNEEEGIILEDDCIPGRDFFHFCEQMLSRYRNVEQVFAITGNNFQNDWLPDASTYYYSKYMHVWGWATWRRAWRSYDGNLTFLPELLSSAEWASLHPNQRERTYWEKILHRVRGNKIDTWDYSWAASIWWNKGLVVTPQVNLVSNIGFGADATHTVSKDSAFANMSVGSMGECKAPRLQQASQVADEYVFATMFNSKRPLSIRLFRWLESLRKKARKH